MSFKPYQYHYLDPRNAKHGLLSKVSAFVVLGIILSLAIFTMHSININKSDEKVTKLQKKDIQNQYEVFGFAPYWTLSKMDNVNFDVLTTLAYFDVPINSDGAVDTESNGYKKFYSPQATELFDKAHSKGTRVVLTISQMDGPTIKKFLDDPKAQNETIITVTDMVKKRGIDGVNIDFEYNGDPGEDYRSKFSIFVEKFSENMHTSLKGSHVTVSVYASAAKYPKMYEIGALAQAVDGVFMMAYDFATTSSETVIPTAPLYGHKEGKYWYDISTAVDDFLKEMPEEKLILGLPWYGYNYPVSQPAVKAAKDNGYYTSYWYKRRKYTEFVARPKAHASTYALARNSGVPDQSGWDEYGQVGWEAHQSPDGWRMIFLDDERSLAVKYEFAKEKGLGGVGMWALGFDDGKTELWDLLARKFGKKVVASNI